MRTLNATLLASMDTGNYDPYFLATIQDNYTGNVILSTAPVGYELSDLELTLTVQMPAFLDVPFYRTSVVLTRGVTIAGLHYTLDSSKFTIINSTWDGNFQTFKCHLVPRVHYSAAGDLTYNQVITAFCATFGKTAVFLTPGAAWLSYQFLPTGKMIILNNAQTFFQQLKQKYFIFACDNGNDEILFYTAFTHVTASQYSVTGYRFALDKNVDQRRQYIWRDENETLHQTVPSFAYSIQIDATVQSVLSLTDLGSGIVLCGTYKNAFDMGLIYRSTDYGQTWTLVLNTTEAGVYSLVSPAPGIVLAAGYPDGFVFRSVDYGLTWNLVINIGDSSTGSLTDCGNGIVLMAHTNSGGTGVQVYKSSDYGLTWANKATLGAETALYAIYYVGAGVCLAGTYPGGKVWRSTDYGDHWSLIQQLGTQTAVQSFVGIGPSIILAGTANNGEIWKSIDAGVTWAKVYSSPEQTIWTLNTLGAGVVLAGTGPNGRVYRSTDYGVTWKLVQALGAELSVRSFITLGNGATLAGTGENAMIFKSLNCAADLDIIHNLGFMPSTAVEPTAYFLLAAPKFDPFPVHLKYQSSDYIHLDLLQGGTYDFTCAEVIEVLDLKSVKPFTKTPQGKITSMSYYMLINQTEWLSNTAVGPLPGTIERVGSYTPLVTANFNGLLSVNDNNVQAAFDDIDDHVRRKLVTGLTYYVRTDGDDANDGLSDDVLGAFLTIQHAVDVVSELDIHGMNLVIQLADGTYNEGVSLKNVIGYAVEGNLIIKGNTATPANVVVNLANYGINAIGLNTTWLIQDMKLVDSPSSTLGVCLYADLGAKLLYRNMEFGTAGFAHVWASALGSVRWYSTSAGTCTISGNSQSHWRSTGGGLIRGQTVSIVTVGTPAFSLGFAFANRGSIILCNGCTFSGTGATGKYFDIQLGALVYTGSNSLTYLPVNAAGTISQSNYDNVQEVGVASGLVGFYGIVPVARPSAYTQTYATASKTVPNMTYVAPSGGGTVDTQARASLVQLAADTLAYLKVITAMIDDLQSLGILQ